MSLPTPPSGILDRDQPWYRGKISDAQYDRLKAKLTGGRDAGGTAYSKLIDCSLGEADKIISNMKKDPRGYPQMYMPGGGEAYQVMIDYYQFLKDAYLYDEPKPEPEEIPVEVEVVEVEQKTVDEPIVIKIEAPFESTPEVKLSAPKRISVPRRSGLVTPTIKKKSLADRMGDAFTNNLLNPLVDSIQNPPAPIPPRQRKQKETLIKIRKNVKPSSYQATKGPGFFQNSGLFLFNKTKDSFGRAAELRKQATAQGMPEQDPGFYLKKALGNELGGDAIARTRGTFSSNPDATLDPALTKQQRLSEGIFGTRTIRKPKESGVATDIERQVNELEKKFNEVIDTKKITPESSQLDKTLKELKDKLSAGNKLQKGINDSKKKLLGLEAKAADAAQARAEEAEMDESEDLSGQAEVEKIQGKKKGEGGGPDFGDMFDKFRKSKWWKRLRNPKRLARTLFRYGRRFLWQPVKAAATKVGAALSGTAATTAAIVGGVGLAASGLGEGIFQLTKKGGAGEKTRDFLKEKGEEMGGPMGALVGGVGNLAGISNEATKVTGNILDVVGAPFRYAIEAVRYPFLNEKDREKQAENLAKFDGRIRENIRGGLNRIDFMNVVPDEKGGLGNIYNNEDANKKMMEKMSEGGVIPKFQEISGARLSGDLGGGTVDAMIGEAGPEMLIPNGQTPETVTSSVNPLQSLAPIIVSLREVTKRAGTWADPVENMVRQITDPIAKTLNLPVIPMEVDIDSPPDDTKKKKTKRGGLLGKIMRFLKGEDSDSSKDGQGGADAPGVTPFDGDVDMGGGEGRTTAGAVYNYLLSKGMSENHAKGITVNISRESGFKLGAHGDKGIGGSFGLFQWNMAAGRGSKMMAAVPDWKTNWKAQIDYALSEFTGPDYLQTPFTTAGDAAHWWMAKWEIPAEHIQAKYSPSVYEGMIQKMGLARGMPVAPPLPIGGGAQVRAVGDSLAEGIAGASNASDNATQGHAPDKVLNNLKSNISKGNTDHVILSTGLTNNPRMLSEARQQMQYLKRQGIPFTVIPVPDRTSNANNNLNSKIQSMAAANGGSYAKSLEGSRTSDGVHPVSYTEQVRKLRLGAS